MKFAECVNNVSTFIDLKRLANEYVIDYKRLSYDELKAAMIKTAPQYYNQENVYNTIESLKLHEDESVRTLLEIIIREVLLNEDNFSLCQKDNLAKKLSCKSSFFPVTSYVSSAVASLSRSRTKM